MIRGGVKPPIIFNLFKKGNTKMSDKRKVRFNLAHAGYHHGEIVNYADMPEGQRFWVDNKSILETPRICEFVEDEKKETELEKVDKTDDQQLKKELKNLKATEKPKNNGLSFDFEKDKTVNDKPLCPGRNKDGNPCDATKLRPNGYCHRHRYQAPTGITGEMEQSAKDVQGLT